jgi:predicted MFS family arabinose efflux permease
MLLTTGLTFGGIAVAVIFAAAFSVLTGSSMDYYLKTHLPELGRTRRLAALNSTSQIALIIGTALGGLLVSRTDAGYAFLFTSLCGPF